VKPRNPEPGADDCFARRDVVELTIELATSAWPGRRPWRHRFTYVRDHNELRSLMIVLTQHVATLASFHVGRPPRNRGRRYPPDPPTVEQIIAVMRAAGHSAEGARLRA
jgi:hypothetical protein